MNLTLSIITLSVKGLNRFPWWADVFQKHSPWTGSGKRGLLQGSVRKGWWPLEREPWLSSLSRELGLRWESHPKLRPHSPSFQEPVASSFCYCQGLLCALISCVTIMTITCFSPLSVPQSSGLVSISKMSAASQSPLLMAWRRNLSGSDHLFHQATTQQVGERYPRPEVHLV